MLLLSLKNIIKKRKVRKVMLEQLKEMIEKMEKANEIVPVEVVMKMDKDGNGMIKCEGRKRRYL